MHCKRKNCVAWVQVLVSYLILYWLMQEFISAHSSSNKFWENVVCMEMGCLIGAIQYICTLTITSSKCSSHVLLINLHICIASEINRYIMCVRKLVYGCLTLSAKSATSFPSVNSSPKFSSCMIEATMTSNASIILPEEDKHCPYVHCLCNYTVDVNLACKPGRA